MNDTNADADTLDSSARAVLEYWFEDTVANDAAVAARMPWWFGGEGDPAARDADCRERFGALLGEASRGALDAWTGTPRGRLALILVLDQLPRNVHRGRAAAFATDARALAVTRAGLALGHDRELAPVERLFFYMPLQHAEDRDAQDESVARFAALAAEAPPALRATLESAHAYALEHRALVQRFGRFPYRNAIVGRESTSDELEWLGAEVPDFARSVTPPG